MRAVTEADGRKANSWPEILAFRSKRVGMKSRLAPRNLTGFVSESVHRPLIPDFSVRAPSEVARLNRPGVCRRHSGPKSPLTSSRRLRPDKKNE